MGHTMVVRMYKNRYITIYYNVKYDVFLGSSNLILFIKTRIARVNPDDHQHICLLWPQILVLLLFNLETPTVYYICFKMVPLRLDFLLCVNYKISLNMGLFRPFYPQFGRFGWAGPDSTRIISSKSHMWCLFISTQMLTSWYVFTCLGACVCDLFHPKMSPTLSLSGMHQKSFIYHTNSTNYQ